MNKIQKLEIVHGAQAENYMGVILSIWSRGTGESHPFTPVRAHLWTQ